jgi:hypothetical protein
VRVVRRVAGSLGAAVVLAAVGPAVANAAGADVPNPVAVALRASGRGLSAAFSPSSDATVTADCDSASEPSAEPSVVASVEPSSVVGESAAPSSAPSSSVEESVAPSVEPSVEESVAPSVVPSVEPSVEVSEAPEPCESEAPEASQAPEASEEPDDEAEDGAHGQLVSTVAKCAPKGKDPLLAVEGSPSNHGGFVRAAAHGESLVTPWGTFDLSTQAGADSLCAAVAAAREALPAETAAPKEHGKSGGEHGKSGEHGKGAKPAKEHKGGKAKPSSEPDAD